MLMLVISFAVITAVVQISRYVKRFYVRRFANNVNRRMKEFLYGSLVKKKAVQACAEKAKAIS